MEIEKRIGKIQDISFGYGGYQDCMLGLSVTLGSSDWGVSDGKFAWDANLIESKSSNKWTEEDRSKQYDKIMRYISDLLYKAKVDDISKLKDIPIEAEFDGMVLKSWRILEEAL